MLKIERHEFVYLEGNHALNCSRCGSESANSSASFCSTCGAMLMYVAVADERVPDTVIRMETEGRTTSESMRAVAGMLEARGLQSALLVSDPFHMLRLRILARRFGFIPYTSPTRTSPIEPNREQRWKYIFSESIKAPLAFFFDAISPDGSTLFVIQYTSAQNWNRYRVRAYDLLKQQLLPGTIADKSEPAGAMAGYPVTRLTTADGRWAYTLYARPSGPSFVHALDTVNRRAVCLDLRLRAITSVRPVVFRDRCRIARRLSDRRIGTEHGASREHQ